MCMNVVKCAFRSVQNNKHLNAAKLFIAKSFNFGVCLEGFAAHISISCESTTESSLRTYTGMGIISHIASLSSGPALFIKSTLQLRNWNVSSTFEIMLELSPSSALCFCVLRLTQRKVRQGVL